MTTTKKDLDVRRVGGWIGAEIPEVRLSSDMDDSIILAIREALLAHKVLFFRDQHHLDPAGHTAVARRYWEEAGVADRIDLRLAPALETLRALPVDEAIDFAFIDADKVNYAAYYEELMLRLRPNGVILVDNTLWSGRVIDLSDTSDDTDAIRAFNDQVASDDRVDCVLLPISDGLTLLRKR